MSDFIRQKHEVLQLLEEARVLARRREIAEVEELLTEAIERVTKGQLFVGVCGEFKQGKSSLLNALLDEPTLFPVDVDVTTALVTTIRDAEKETIRVWFEDRQRAPAIIDRREIADYVTEQGNPENEQEARLLAIETPNRHLRDGLVLFDTPGVGGINIRHSDITLALIPNVDVVIFVSDVLAPLSQNELTFIRESILPHSLDIIFVITKIDQERAYERVIEANRQRLASLLGRDPQAVEMLGVSSRNKLDYLGSGDEEDFADSRFAELEATLWRVLNERSGHLLTLRGLTELRRALGQLRTPLQAALDACRAESQKEIDEIDATLRVALERLRKLEDEAAEWRTALAEGLDDIRRVVLDHEYDAGVHRVRSRVNRLLADERYLKAPARLVESVQAEVIALATALTKSILRRAAILQTRIEVSSSIHVTTGKVEAIVIDVESPDVAGIAEAYRGVWSKVVDVGKEATLSGTGAGLLGSILGALVGGAAAVITGGLAAPAIILGAQIGGALGTVAGTATGIKRGLSNVNTQDRAKAQRIIRETIGPFLDESLTTCRTKLDGSFSALRHAMIGEFMGKLIQERKSLERARIELDSTRGLTHAQALHRAAEIQVYLDEIAQIESRAVVLAESILASARGGASATEPPLEADSAEHSARSYT